MEGRKEHNFRLFEKAPFFQEHEWHLSVYTEHTETK
jgi:hypothetical protein